MLPLCCEMRKKFICQIKIPSKQKVQILDPSLFIIQPESCWSAPPSEILPLTSLPLPQYCFLGPTSILFSETLGFSLQLIPVGGLDLVCIGLGLMRSYQLKTAFTFVDHTSDSHGPLSRLFIPPKCTTHIQIWLNVFIILGRARVRQIPNP